VRSLVSRTATPVGVGATSTQLPPFSPLKLLVDHVLKQAPLPEAFAGVLDWLGIAPTTAFLLGLAVFGTLTIFTLNNGLEAMQAWLWTVGGRRMVYDLAEDVFSKLQRRSVLFHSRTPIGDIMSRTSSDSWAVYQLFETFFAPLQALLTIAVMAFLMWQLDATMTVVALLIAPLMLLGSMLMGKPLRAAARLRREMEVRLQSHIQQTLTGIPVVQAVRPLACSNAVSQGKGLDLCQAAVSAVLEAVETFFAEAVDTLDAFQASADELAISRGSFERHLRCETPDNWRSLPVAWTMGTDILGGGQAPVPFELVHTYFVQPPLPTDGLIKVNPPQGDDQSVGMLGD
jgi:hypothetical protein